MERETLTAPRGQWKKRLGWGGRNKGKPMVLLKADGHTTDNNYNNNNSHNSSNSSVPPDDGDARTLRRQAKKNSFFRSSFRRNKNNNNISSSQTVDTESRDDGPQRTPTHSAPPHRSNSKAMMEEKKWDEPSSSISSPRNENHPIYNMEKHQQQLKERDGFCRRVSEYDGNLIKIDSLPTYEIGNYLGGGVAGVVYQGHRLRPLSEYPVRSGVNEHPQATPSALVSKTTGVAPSSLEDEVVGLFCGHFDTDKPCGGGELDTAPTVLTPTAVTTMDEQDTLATLESPMNTSMEENVTSPRTTAPNTLTLDTDFTHQQPNHNPSVSTTRGAYLESADVAIETTMTLNDKAPVVLLDAQDAPSRSQHFSKAAGVSMVQPTHNLQHHLFRSPTAAAAAAAASDQNKFRDLAHGLTDEAVAVKILNPVAYRLLTAEALKEAIVVKRGEPMDMDVRKGKKPMTEKHVWWLVNPNSRNLRTLQRYNEKEKTSLLSSTKSANNSGNANVQVDRGSEDHGLRLSLIAAYIDPRSNSTQLQELPLTRCIEIWGHVPFNASDMEFEDFIIAIERVNAGHAPNPSGNWKTLFNEPQKQQQQNYGENPQQPPTATDASRTGAKPSEPSQMAMLSAQTGLVRAALSERKTVFCKKLNAYIAISSVPTKYIRWLRQRRAATKEVRNMLLIGRHPNVLHLFEVLEYIQESKSTMFLILELVKGGELFDLISSGASGKNKKRPDDNDKVEQMMRKFFYELASGINYCHENGIAHRDLKPENLLVHNGSDGESTLKIADFGLSAAFGPNSLGFGRDTDDSSLRDSAGGAGSPMSQGSSNGFSPKNAESDTVSSPTSQASSSSAVKESMDKLIASGANALSFLTCGAMENILCFPMGNAILDGPSTLRRMTSVVGSPHYVAPEIISQHDESKRASSSRSSSRRGYDGAKADVWSCGVILYAMLFRSLPFGEDLLRCPRYQSYRKWYDEVRQTGGRRSSAAAALSSSISSSEERDYLGPHWFFPVVTSKESRDLIVAMLNPKPEDRLSVAQVLQHSWVKMISKKG